MSGNNLFPPEDFNDVYEDGKWKVVIGAVSFVFLILVAAVGHAWWVNNGGAEGLSRRFFPKSKTPGNDLSYETNNVRRHILAYLAQPRFAGEEFERQILGPAHLELFRLDTDDVYFSLPETESAPDRLKVNFDRLFVDPKKVETANAGGGGWMLGGYTLLKSEKRGSFFKSPADNVKIRPEMILSFKFERGVYTLTLKEMTDYLLNRMIYGGPLRADTGRAENGVGTFFFNHAAFVAKPKEPSLKRFVAELTKDIPDTDEFAREKRVQRVMDFVSNEIVYDESEATRNVETLKRPNEILMSRRGDCSNKVILLASLLEQLGEDYLVLYCPRHVTIGLKPGRFPVENGLTRAWEGKTWLIAESTAEGFRIGITRLQEAEKLTDVRYIQRSVTNSVIFDAATTETLSFR